MPRVWDSRRHHLRQSWLPSDPVMGKRNPKKLQKPAKLVFDDDERKDYLLGELISKKQCVVHHVV